MFEPVPCPLCGKKPKFTGFKSCLGYYGNLTCTDSRHHVEVSVNAETEKEAVKKAILAWNKRHYPADVQQAIARMKPMKVINKWSQHGIEYGDCPACICPVENKEWNDHPHCERCAQALDWETENE